MKGSMDSRDFAEMHYQEHGPKNPIEDGRTVLEGSFLPGLGPIAYCHRCRCLFVGSTKRPFLCWRCASPWWRRLLSAFRWRT